MPKDVTDDWIRNSGVGNVEFVFEIGVHFCVWIAEPCTVTCCCVLRDPDLLSSQDRRGATIVRELGTSDVAPYVWVH